MQRESELRMTENPYSAPNAELVEPSSVTGNRYARVGEVVVTWEKLRLVYNGILAPFSILLFVASLYVGSTKLASFSELVIFGGGLANLCFCAGPLVDGYLTWFGIRSRRVTGFLFVSGLLLTMLLVIVAVFPPGVLLPTPF